MWSIRSMMLKYLMQQGIDIIIDETNTTKARRAPILKMAKHYGYHIIGNVVEGHTPDMCKERAIREGQNDLIPIIDMMAEQFEMPEKEEGFDEINMV
jgi:predicted kinase